MTPEEPDESRIDTQVLLGAIRRRLGLLLGVPLLAAVLATVGMQLQTPKYEATATVRVSTASSGEGDPIRTDDIAYTERLISTYARLLKSKPVVDEIAAASGAVEAAVLDVNAPSNSELMSVTATATSPQAAAKTANAAIVVLTKQIQENVESDLGGAVSELEIQIQRARELLAEAEATYASKARPAKGVVASDADLRPAFNAMDRADTALVNLLAEKERLARVKAARTNTIAVVEAAEPPTHASSPRPKLIIPLALVLGFLAGFVLALLAERIDSRLRTPDMLARVTGSPVLGVIPAQRREDPPIAAGGSDKAFRRLRTNLLEVHGRDRLSPLLIAGVGDDGSSRDVTVGLARSLARAGNAVAVIDADLHGPCLHEDFGTGNEAGLAQYAAGEASIAEALQPTSLDGVKLMPAGHWSGPEADLPELDDVVMSALAADLASYDFVLVRAPSIIDHADAVVLAPTARGVLLSADPDVATRESVAAAVEQLNLASARLVGVVAEYVRASRPRRPSVEGRF